MGRAPCCEKVGLKKGRWTAEEDETLTKYIQANGEGSWRSLPKNAGLLRCGKSCRLRWINYLRADLKRGNISAEEDGLIVKLHASFGNRWSLIASHLPGRTDNEIKNYWNSHLSRKIYTFRGPSSTDTNITQPGVIMDAPKVTIPPKRKGGRTSRWAMKKNKSYTYTPKERPNPKQNVIQKNDEAAVPLPPTPSLESEGLSSSMVDFMALDPDIEREELADEPSSYQETYDSLFNYGGDREGLELEGQCPEKEGIKTNEMPILCFDGEKEASDILSPYQLEEGINGGCGALSFDDIMMDNCLQEACGFLALTEERESNGVIGTGEENETWGNACHNKMVIMNEDPESSVNASSNGESGEWQYSCSSKALDLDDDYWDWESIIELNDHNNESESWEHKENLLTWLWDDDDWESDCKNLGDIDPQKQNDMVAWFLS